MGTNGGIQKSKMQVCKVKSFYIPIIGVHRNGICYKWIVLESDNLTKELEENDHFTILLVIIL